MSALSTLIFSLLITLSNGLPNKRQLPDLSGILAPAVSPVGTRKLTPVFNPKATREIVTWGPFKLNAKKTANSTGPVDLSKLDQNSDTFAKLVTGLCDDCVVLSAVSKVTDKVGKKLDIGQGVYTHHVVIVDIGKAQGVNPAFVKCDNALSLNPFGGWGSIGAMSMGGGMLPSAGAMGGGGHSHGGKIRTTSVNPAEDTLNAMVSGTSGPAKLMAGGTILSVAGLALSGLGAAILASGIEMPGGAAVFVGAGSEGTEQIYTTNNTAVKAGFRLEKKEKMYLTAEVVNYDAVDKDVYLSVEYEYIPKAEDYLDVAMGAINVDGCANTAKEAMAPPKDKPMTFTSPEWIVVHDGWLVKAIPHMHDGGVNAKFLLNGKVVCSSKAIYGGESASVDGKKWQTITAYEECKDPVKIRVGDRLTMSVEYDLSKYSLRPSSAEHNKEAEAMGIGLLWWAKEKSKA